MQAGDGVIKKERTRRADWFGRAQRLPRVTWVGVQRSALSRRRECRGVGGEGGNGGRCLPRGAHSHQSHPLPLLCSPPFPQLCRRRWAAKILWWPPGVVVVVSSGQVAGVRATRAGVTQPPSKPILSPTFSVSTASELDRKGLVCNFAVITLIQL